MKGSVAKQTGALTWPGKRGTGWRKDQAGRACSLRASSVIPPLAREFFLWWRSLLWLATLRHWVPKYVGANDGPWLSDQGERPETLSRAWAPAPWPKCVGPHVPRAGLSWLERFVYWRGITRLTCHGVLRHPVFSGWLEAGHHCGLRTILRNFGRNCLENGFRQARVKCPVFGRRARTRLPGS